MKNRYRVFLAAMLFSGLAFGLFRGVQDNYLAILGVGKAGRGVVEFFRELPGLMLFIILVPFYRMAERNIIRVSLGICALAILGFLFSGPNMIPAVVFLVIWSVGDHMVMPVRKSYAIHSADPGQEGRALGVLMGVENAGQVAGLGLVSLIFLIPGVKTDGNAGGRGGFVVVFITILVFLIAGFLAAMGMSRSGAKLERRKIYFHRKFMRFYGLEMFYGARKQVTITFAPYLLILQYGARTGYMAALMGVCALVNIFFNPVIGRIIDRLGYRVVMIWDTVVLFFLCLMFGFAHRLFAPEIALAAVSVTFVLDWMVSNASMAASVYVSRISGDRDEITATLSTGISINHLVSVAIALLGGVIWESLGVELLFCFAALMAVANTLFALSIPRARIAP